MNPARYQLPWRANLLIATLQLAALLSLFWLAGRVTTWPALLLVSIAYGVVMNSAYAMMHEAEHGLLHPRRPLNDFVGVLLALFFPASFHLTRQGHLGHHLRNRSDDEAFDFYFEGENPWWKRLQLYGILTGCFWLVIFLVNIVAVLWPWFLQPRKFSLDKPTEALFRSLNKKFLPFIWLECLAVLLLHGGLMWWWQVPVWHWFAMLCGFGLQWSSMQYVHHFGTSRDVRSGARNLRTWGWLDLLWLNHNWHLRHHLHPTVPWVYLPFLEQGREEPRGNLIAAYLNMWRGPRLTHEHVENRHADKLIR